MQEKGTNNRVFKFRAADIAAATHRSIHTVREERREGIFDPNDIASLARYVHGHIITRRVKWK